MDRVFQESNLMIYPIFLISVYGIREHWSFSDSHTYMEYHEINNDGSYAEARPMPENILRSFGESVANNMNLLYNFRGEIPYNLMYYAIKAKDMHVVWYTPPQEVQMFFSPGTNVKSGLYKVPGLIWKVFRGTLKVFAYKTFKGKETELYEGPFPNVTKGNVCLGSTKVEINGNTFQDILNAWETGFWKSEFSHNDHYAGIFRNLKDNKFPLSRLKKANLKAYSLWKDIIL